MPNIFISLANWAPLRVFDDSIAEKTAQELEAYHEQGARHLAEVQAVLDEEGSSYTA